MSDSEPEPVECRAWNPSGKKCTALGFGAAGLCLRHSSLKRMNPDLLLLEKPTTIDPIFLEEDPEDEEEEEEKAIPSTPPVETKDLDATSNERYDVVMRLLRADWLGTSGPPTRLIGEGAHAFVFLCEDPRFVVKTPRTMKDSELLRMEVQEMRRLGKSECPWIPTIVGSWVTQGVGTIAVMPALKGPDLKHRPRMRVTTQGRQLLAALEAVHKAGYVYRDINAGNAMRDDKDNMHLIDYGGLREIEDAAAIEEFEGTPTFVARIMHTRARTRYAPRDDIESLGYLLEWAIRDGELPWTGLPGDQMYIAKSCTPLSAPVRGILARANTPPRAVGELYRIQPRPLRWRGARVGSIGGNYGPPHAGHYASWKRAIEANRLTVLIISSTNMRDAEIARHGAPLAFTHQVLYQWARLLEQETRVAVLVEGVYDPRLDNPVGGNLRVLPADIEDLVFIRFEDDSTDPPHRTAQSKLSTMTAPHVPRNKIFEWTAPRGNDNLSTTRFIRAILAGGRGGGHRPAAQTPRVVRHVVETLSGGHSSVSHSLNVVVSRRGAGHTVTRQCFLDSHHHCRILVLLVATNRKDRFQFHSITVLFAVHQ